MMPSYLALFTAEPSKILLNVSSVSSTQFLFLIDESSFFGLKLSSLWGLENLFQGHTSWQISHPKIASFRLIFNSLGISFLFSIVRYEMHLLASITWAEVIASVGHASIHLVHLPHLSFVIVSYSSSRSQIISARKK